MLARIVVLQHLNVEVVKGFMNELKNWRHKIMDESWAMRSAWVSQPSAINKLLRDGFEPFWGYRLARNINGQTKQDVRMYFRKSPELVTELTALEEKTLTPISVGIDLAAFEKLGVMLDEFANKLAKLIDGKSHSTYQLPVPNSLWPSRIMPASNQDDVEVSEEIDKPEVQSAQAEVEVEVEPNTPVDELSESRKDIKPVDEGVDIPVVTTVERTPQQDRVIESLKSTYGNVSILPGGENGIIRVMAGANIYHINPDGNYKTEETGANTSSLGL